MIVYYSKTGNTFLYAKALSDKSGSELFKLEEEKKLYPLELFFMCLFKKGAKVKILPNVSKNVQITICSPIYMGFFEPHIIYFLNSVNLKDATVNLVLTSGGYSQKYLDNAINYIEKRGAKVNKTLLKQMPLTPKPTLDEITKDIEEFYD